MIFLIEMLCTNNSIEDWHQRCESNLTVAHPGFWKFLNTLKREENLSRVDILQANGRHRRPDQQRRYVDFKARIIAIVDDYLNRNRMNFLRDIDHDICFLK